MKNGIYTIAFITVFTSVVTSCKMLGGGKESSIRESVVTDKTREVPLNGNNGKLFDILTGEKTGLNFVNDLTDSYTVNWWRYSYIYNGGAVCIGDVNKDGLPDLFFTGNLVPNKLYLNKGNLQFEDVTEKAGLKKDSWEWNYGANMVDVDGDDDLDIYICNSRWDTPEKRKNRLWMNNGDMTFTEASEKMGLADDSYSTIANFFDYDNDGDLDMYQVTHPVDFIDKNKTNAKIKIEGGRNVSNRFYRNNGDGTYSEIHKEIGINNHGYGLSGTVGDLNDDGFLDVYVANDYAMYDFIYMNDGKGKFMDASLSAIKKGSINAMGVDINDFNNDGHLDIIVADMDMEENYTYKTFMLSSQVEVMRILFNSGYGYQNRSNSLQLNNGNGTFGEISRTAGVSTTDWSWSTIFADFDNDGNKDLFISNGFLRDFHVDESETYHKLRRAVRINDSTVYKEVRKDLPDFILDHPNYIFKNNGDLTFTDTRDEWGVYYPSITYGSGYADLDNDGDIDIVSSNVNQTPWIYRNNSEKLNTKNNYISIHLEGYAKNSDGLGTKVRIFCGDKMQYIQSTNVRGYISTMQHDVHFGLGSDTQIDRIEVEWLDGAKQILQNVPANQILTIKHADASKSVTFPQRNTQPKYFADATTELGINYIHKENNYDDYLREYLLPHKMSSLAPGIASGDLNGDGLDDFYVGGAINSSGALYFQTADGKFMMSDFQKNNPDDLQFEDAGALIFDADGDGDNDLYVATGGNEHPVGDVKYADRLYLNDGKGNLSRKSDALPTIYSSSSCVTGADYDKDGDIDLFVGGRQVPGEYLAPSSSYILKNEGGKFTDASAEVAPTLKDIGMITSAIWTDYNNDNNIDLILTGDWMPITILKNQGGKFVDQTEEAGIKNATGWWQSITGADFDNDGDIDYMVGNFGTNRRYKNTVATKDKTPLPLEAFLDDFDGNGKKDFVMCYYQYDMADGTDKLFPVKTRERILEQLPSIADDFKTWDSYGKASVYEVLGDSKVKNALHRTAYVFHSTILVNEGNGKFSMKYLPNEVQISSTFGVTIDDFNNDGFMDILQHGNFYNTEIEITRHDAGTGVLLLGKGDCTFTPVRSMNSGFWSDGDAKGLSVILNGKTGQPLVLCGNSAGAMKAFGLTDKSVKTIKLDQNACVATITMKDGKTSRLELYNGSGYISQNSKYIRITPNITNISVTDYKGNSVTVYPSATAQK
ncbi:MAG: VCBS repeat-containing protein [Chitinophagales bacterium]